MKTLNITQLVLTCALLIVVAAMAFVIYRQQQLLNEISLSLIGVQEIEWAKLTPCQADKLERTESY